MLFACSAPAQSGRGISAYSMAMRAAVDGDFLPFDGMIGQLTCVADGPRNQTPDGYIARGAN
jgi:hypothetical protein